MAAPYIEACADQPAALRRLLGEADEVLRKVRRWVDLSHAVTLAGTQIQHAQLVDILDTTLLGTAPESKT